jgi:hypothetical protein
MSALGFESSFLKRTRLRILILLRYHMKSLAISFLWPWGYSRNLKKQERVRRQRIDSRQDVALKKLGGPGLSQRMGF